MEIILKTAEEDKTLPAAYANSEAVVEGIESIGASNSDRKNAQLTAEECKYLQESIYIAAIDRYFDVSGLVRYATIQHKHGRDVAFKHAQTDERFLVFSRLDGGVFDIDEAMEQKHKVIIDCHNLSLPFGGCDCGSEQCIHDQAFYDAQEREFYLLHNGILWEAWNNEDNTFICGGCWGRMRPHILEEVHSAVQLIGAPSSSATITR
ncbi:MAG: hypothetical protein ABMA13_05565 [Chthoniobacteraceae bacterium]